MRDMVTTVAMGPIKVNVGGTKLDVPEGHLAEVSIWHGPYVGVKLAEKIGEQVGVLVRNEAGALVSIEDTGEMHWIEGES